MLVALLVPLMQPGRTGRVARARPGELGEASAQAGPLEITGRSMHIHLPPRLPLSVPTLSLVAKHQMVLSVFTMRPSLVHLAGLAHVVRVVVFVHGPRLLVVLVPSLLIALPPCVRRVRPLGVRPVVVVAIRVRHRVLQVLSPSPFLSPWVPLLPRTDVHLDDRPGLVTILLGVPWRVDPTVAGARRLAG